MRDLNSHFPAVPPGCSLSDRSEVSLPSGSPVFISGYINQFAKVFCHFGDVVKVRSGWHEIVIGRYFLCAYCLRYQPPTAPQVG